MFKLDKEKQKQLLLGVLQLLCLLILHGRPYALLKKTSVIFKTLSVELEGYNHDPQAQPTVTTWGELT